MCNPLFILLLHNWKSEFHTYIHFLLSTYILFSRFLLLVFGLGFRKHKNESKRSRSVSVRAGRGTRAARQSDRCTTRIRTVAVLLGRALVGRGARVVARVRRAGPRAARAHVARRRLVVARVVLVVADVVLVEALLPAVVVVVVVGLGAARAPARCLRGGIHHHHPGFSMYHHYLDLSM